MSRGWSLARRITIASATAAALGGSVSALAAGVTARSLVTEHEQRTLLAAARELADEIDEELADVLDDDDEEEQDFDTSTPSGALAHELKDVMLEGAAAVLRQGSAAIAGDAQLPQLAPNTCAELRVQQRAVRACTVARAHGTLTLAAPMEAEHTRAALLVRSLWIGLLSGAALGALSSYLLARWAIEPLNRLRDRVRAVNVHAPNGSVLATAAAQPEVEELRAAIASLIEQLGSALEHARSFAAQAAHELRTPLTMISGELELLATDAHPDQNALTRVRRQVAQLTELVQRLLVLAQPVGMHADRVEVVDLSDVSSDAYALLSAAGRARVQMTCEDDVVVRGDGALLRALLSNALDNALKFSTGPVALRIGKHDGSAHIDVIDDGPGVSQAERVRVFEPFYRAAATRAAGAVGHGLGLSLIARVALTHGGQATFVDRPHGAQLRVQLPLWQASDAR